MGISGKFKTATVIGAVLMSLASSAAFADDVAKPAQGGTLIYLEQQPHTNLYPPAGGFYPNGGVLNQITDKLTFQNPKTLEIEPWIAESWTVNDNATEYTFKLRKGVTFSDGSPLDANAVAKNFDTFGLGNKELKQPVSEVINNYDRSEVIDPLTVKFYFKKPSPGFLQGTSVIGSGLVSLATLALPFEQLGDATKIVGSGPFVVESETLGKELSLKVREDYVWGPAKIEHHGRAYLDGIKYVITGEDSVRIGALLSGQADFIRQVQAYDEAQVEGQGYKIYAAVSQQWAKLGVTLNVLAGDAGSRTVDDLDPAKTPVSPAMVGRADPDVIKSQYYPKNRDVLRQKGGPSDKVKSFVDNKLNGLLEALSSEPNREKRLQIAGEVQSYVLDQAYAIPIFEEPQAYAGAPYLQGVEFEAVGRPRFYSTWLAEH
ncbi:ABC transporter substrate-binding protein [Pararhizobium sp. DWP3-4]|uniref:ABC transporter substrate-binding protein n=1 Tax=Pararhizobium sp. DWP3-4 TaxID=2804565 RepID=UPI003CF62AE5